jgi:hypothetical protein
LARAGDTLVSGHSTHAIALSANNPTDRTNSAAIISSMRESRRSVSRLCVYLTATEFKAARRASIRDA